MILITVILVVEVPWRSGSFPLAGDPVSSHVNFLTAANLKSVIRPRWESIYFVKKKIWNFLCAESNWTVSNFRFHFSLWQMLPLSSSSGRTSKLKA